MLVLQQQKEHGKSYYVMLYNIISGISILNLLLRYKTIQRKPSHRISDSHCVVPENNHTTPMGVFSFQNSPSDFPMTFHRVIMDIFGITHSHLPVM